jgi:hypothetical protein
MRGILRAGIDGGISCLNGWEMYDDFPFHRPCIFQAHFLRKATIGIPIGESKVAFRNSNEYVR